MKIFSLILALLTSTASLHATESIHYYDLSKRPAEEVIPLVQPFLEPQEAISGEGYQLFIKATATRAQELEELITNIDKSVDTFKISITNSQNHSRAQNSISGSARIESGDTTVQVGKHQDKNSSVDIRADSTARDSQNNHTQFVQVQEGKPAYISTATMRIAPVYSYVEKPDGSYIIENYYPSSQDGFFVIVRSSDNKTANVNIQSAASGGKEKGVYQGYGQEQTYLNTNIQVPLGKWFEIGGITENSTSSSSGILSRNKRSKDADNSFFMKVELVN